jgi:hypothetical protein
MGESHIPVSQGAKGWITWDNIHNSINITNTTFFNPLYFGALQKTAWSSLQLTDCVHSRVPSSPYVIETWTGN